MTNRRIHYLHSMYQYFRQYFSANKKVVLPGIGYFTATVNPAELDFINKSLKGPEYGIAFHANVNATDPGFIEFLSLQSGNNETDCAIALNDFVNTVRLKLRSGEEEHFPDIGSLKLAKGTYVFQADNSLQKYFPPVTAEKIVRHDATHTIRVGEEEKTSAEMHKLLNTEEEKKERWWITAVALAAVGIAAIIYYYWLL